jgi:hypothetical protein
VASINVTDDMPPAVSADILPKWPAAIISTA